MTNHPLDALVESRMRGTRTSGSEGGGGETTSRKADTALRRRPLHRRGQRYLTSVADHATGAIVWCAPGRNSATLQGFFAELGERRTRSAPSRST